MERQRRGRRRDGEGCISQLKDGRYRSYITLETGGRKWFRGKREKDVREKMTQWKSLQQGGRLPQGRDQRFDAFMETWLKTTARPSVRASTLENYERCIGRTLPHIGHIKIRSLTAQHLRQLYADMKDAGLADTTVQTSHVIIKQALQQAEDDELIPKNPARAVRFKVHRKEQDSLTQREVEQFLVANAHHRLYPLWVFFFLTGARRGEALALRWEDLDLDASTFQIRRSLLKITGGEPVYGPPKTAVSGKRLSMHPDVTYWLRLHRLRQDEERLHASYWEDQDLVFCTRNGKPIDPPGAWRRFQEALARAELRPLKLHSTRHSFASILYKLSGDIKFVQIFLRHANLAVTDIYTHVGVEELADRLSVLDGLVGTGQAHDKN